MDEKKNIEMGKCALDRGANNVELWAETRRKTMEMAVRVRMIAKGMRISAEEQNLDNDPIRASSLSSFSLGFADVGDGIAAMLDACAKDERMGAVALLSHNILSAYMASVMQPGTVIEWVTEEAGDVLGGLIKAMDAEEKGGHLERVECVVAGSGFVRDGDESGLGSDLGSDLQNSNGVMDGRKDAKIGNA